MSNPENNARRPDFIELQDAPYECGIIPGRIAQTSLALGSKAISQLYNEAIDWGFSRTFGDLLVRDDCPDCNECKPVRTNVNEFLPLRSKNLRRVFNRNSQSLIRTQPQFIEVDIQEHAKLYYHYRKTRLQGEESTNMEELIDEIFEYNVNLDTKTERTSVFEYRGTSSAIPQPAPLKAALWMREVDSGLALETSYFDPKSHTSLGSYMILDSIMEAQKRNLPYIYYGPWTRIKSPLTYKSRFANEVYVGGGKWEALELDA